MSYFPSKLGGLDSGFHYNLTHSDTGIFSLPGIATRSIYADLLGILREILVYDIGGLYTKHNREYNVFLHEPFLVLSLKRVVLEENRSIKTDLVTFLFLFICYVSYLTWPDPPASGSCNILRRGHWD
jgi:hypothetical protein